MKGFERLMHTVGVELDARDGRNDLSAVRLRLRERRRPVGTRPRLVHGAALLGAAALAVVAIGAPWRRTPLPLGFRIGESQGGLGQWIAPRSEPQSLVFTDGTTMTLAPGARARIVRLDGAGADLLLENGRTSVDVSPRRGARWRVLVGPFEVGVTGTRFEVSWMPDADQLEVVLHEGSIVVSGCVFEQGHPVSAPRTVRASCSKGRLEASVESPTGGSAAESGAEEAVSPAPKASIATPEVAAPPLAARHDARGPAPIGEREAQAATNADFASECERADPATLLKLGDAARYAGRLERARLAYSTLRRRFPGRPEASDAAFRLGRIAFDQRSAPAEAARWFAAYLEERPSGPLAREAHGRLLEALSRAGDATGARRVALTYLSAHPGGPHAALARSLAGNGRE